MNPRACLLAALLISPAWAEEPASFDLKSDTIRKVVQDAASRQFADARVVDEARVKSEPAEFKYVPPEKTAVPVREPPDKLPAESPRSDDFVSALFEIMAEELLGIEGDDADASSLILRCWVKQDVKSAPPGPDDCPSGY